MANRKVYQRNLNVSEKIPRSLQNLSQSHSWVSRYGQISPIFHWQLYPNETIRVNLTNFIRTIPMKTPQLSRVKVYTRFIAVPNRIMWRPFEDYIDPLHDNDYGEDLVEPYVANFNCIARFSNKNGQTVYNNENFLYELNSIHYTEDSISTLKQDLYNIKHATDWSINGIVETTKNTSGVDIDVITGGIGITTARCVRVDNDESKHVPTNTSFYGYQFFPRELGDYLNYPIYSTHISSIDPSTRISAWTMCAYQMAYAYQYRRPNVEEATDDFWEMCKVYNDSFFAEFSSFYLSHKKDEFRLGEYNNQSFSPIVSEYLDFNSHYGEGYRKRVNPPAIIREDGPGVFKFVSDDANGGLSPQRWNRWDKVEKFPLKNGANMVLHAEELYGDSLKQIPTSISLTRIRFAPFTLDRFTSSNPWQQRGDESFIAVIGEDLDGITYEKASSDGWYSTSDVDFITFSANQLIPAETYGSMTAQAKPAAGRFMGEGNSYRPRVNLKTVAESLYISPSTFRFAMQLQKIKEMSARTDGRYKSFLEMFYGSRPEDYRLDRPEFIGGFVQDLNISEIAQTAQGESGNPADSLGTLAGRGTSSKRSSQIYFHTKEHAVLLALVHIMPETVYTGGLNRLDNTINPYDWMIPQFAGLSEQPIRNKELAALSTSFDVEKNIKLNDAAFGYEPRYNEFRAAMSYATGDFRDVLNSRGSYEFFKPWLNTRNFGYATTVSTDQNEYLYCRKLEPVIPTLSHEFLTTRHNVDNSNFEVTNEDIMFPFICDSYAEVRWTRCIPEVGIPRI